MRSRTKIIGCRAASRCTSKISTVFSEPRIKRYQKLVLAAALAPMNTAMAKNAVKARIFSHSSMLLISTASSTVASRMARPQRLRSQSVACNSAAKPSDVAMKSTIAVIGKPRRLSLNMNDSAIMAASRGFGVNGIGPGRWHGAATSRSAARAPATAQSRAVSWRRARRRRARGEGQAPSRSHGEAANIPERTGLRDAEAATADVGGAAFAPRADGAFRLQHGADGAHRAAA